MDISFRIKALAQAPCRTVNPEILDIGQVSQFTNEALTELLKQRGAAISMDGRTGRAAMPSLNKSGHSSMKRFTRRRGWVFDSANRSSYNSMCPYSGLKAPTRDRAYASRLRESRAVRTEEQVTACRSRKSAQTAGPTSTYSEAS
jgi:hypothetical protein